MRNPLIIKGIIGTIASAFLILLPVVFPVDGENGSEAMIAIGRFHILSLHIPIGLILLVPVLELMATLKRWSYLKKSVGIILGLAVISSVITCVLGFMLARAEGYAGQLIYNHMWSGICMSVLMIIALLVRDIHLASRSNASAFAYGISLFSGIAALTIGSHHGASLVHGKDFLFAYLPDNVRSLLQLKDERPAAINFDSVVLHTVIEPILSENCRYCHGDGKIRGQYRMDSHELLLAGGKSNLPGIIPGDAENSELYQRITLDRDHEKAMPPIEEKPLDEEDVALIKWWIDGGASDSMKVGDLMDHHLPDEIEEIITRKMGLTADDPPALDLGMAGDVTSHLKEAYGIDVFAYSQDPADGLYIVARNATGRIPIQALKELLPIEPHIKSMNFWGQTFEENTLREISAFTNLRELHLNETNVTEPDLVSISRLIRLRLLNLHGTGIGDDSVNTLSSMRMLRKLLLVDSQMSPEGITRLQESLIHCEIIASSPSLIEEKRHISLEEAAFQPAPNWGIPPGSGHDHGIGSTHGGIAVDKEGNIYASSHEGLFVFDEQGNLQRSYTDDAYHDIHSLTLVEDDGIEYIFGSRNNDAEVIKLRTDGEIIQRIPFPTESGVDGNFKPTAVAVTPDGNILIADGYGSNYIFQFDQEGNYISAFGGKDPSNPEKFRTPHGLAIDTRYEPVRLLVSDREKRRLVHFDLDGNFLEEAISGLRRPCAVSIMGDYVAVAELAGRIVILNKENKIISVLGDNPDDSQQANFKVAPSDWKDGIHTAPHGLSWDMNGNLYVQDWNSYGRLTKWELN